MIFLVFVTACTCNAQNTSESSTNNSPEKKANSKQEMKENANIIREIDRTEYLTGEIISDGEYDINTNTVKEYDLSIHHMQEYNNYIYSYSNAYISRHEIDNISKFDKIYELDDDYIIKRISVIDDLIFFTYAYDYTRRDEKVIFVDVVNVDGSNRRNIFQFEYSTLGHYDFDKIYVLNDKLFVISTDSQYSLFKVFDYESNELWSFY